MNFVGDSNDRGEASRRQQLADLFAEAERKLLAMYEVHDMYFTADPKEKQDKLSSLRDEVLHILDERDGLLSSLEDASGRPRRDTGGTRGCVLYVRGKALDVCDAHSVAAEECLMKAVKLLPERIDAYNALGNCLWKRGTVDGMRKARDCFNNALRQQENKESMRLLSMVLRQLGKGTDEYVGLTRALWWSIAFVVARLCGCVLIFFICCLCV